MGRPLGAYTATGSMYGRGRISSASTSVCSTTARIAASVGASLGCGRTEGMRMPFHWFDKDLTKTHRFPRKTKAPIWRWHCDQSILPSAVAMCSVAGSSSACWGSGSATCSKSSVTSKQMRSYCLEWRFISTFTTDKKSIFPSSLQ